MDLKRYQDFVEAVTSEESQNLDSFVSRLGQLDGNGEPNVNMPLLLCGAIGLGSETGEFQEIVKKCVFQGKPLDEQTHFHMSRELGDILFYWISACRSLGLNPDDVITENVRKLENRYPNGFSVEKSENRKKDDI